MIITYLDINNNIKMSDKMYNILIGHESQKVHTNILSKINKKTINIFTCQFNNENKICLEHFFSEENFPIIYYIYVPNFLAIQYEYFLKTPREISISIFYYLAVNIIQQHHHINFIQLQNEPYVIKLNKKNVSEYIFSDYRAVKNISPHYKFYPDVTSKTDFHTYQLSVSNHVITDNMISSDYVNLWSQKINEKNTTILLLDWKYLLPYILYDKNNQNILKTNIQKMGILANVCTVTEIENDICLYTIFEFLGITKVYTSNYKFNVIMKKFYKFQISPIIENEESILFNPFHFNKYESIVPLDKDAYANKVIVLTQYFILNYPNPAYNLKRQSEFNTCILNNVMNPHIDEIHLLLERPVMFHFLSEEQQKKIKQIIIYKRMTYFDAFDYYNKFIPNSIAILCNNDIYASKVNLHLLKEFPDTIYKDTFYCLTRYENHNNHKAKYLNNSNIGNLSCCQDIWLWKMPQINTTDTQFYLGILGCDNYIPVIMSNNGYKVYNTSGVFLFEHLDNVSMKEFSKKLSDNRSIRIGSMKWYKFLGIEKIVPQYATHHELFNYNASLKSHICNLKEINNKIKIIYVSATLNRKSHNLVANIKSVSVFVKYQDKDYELCTQKSFDFHRSQDYMSVIFIDTCYVESIKLVIDEWYQNDFIKYNFNSLIECFVGYDIIQNT